MDIGKQYSTCGVNGINEALEILGYNVLKQDGQEFVKQILTKKKRLYLMSIVLKS